MSYKNIKILILIIPTLTIAVWEFVRHEYLLPYISMELGNWLAPVLVFLVSITLLLKLFGRMEQLQAQLREEQAAKAVLEEREALARELHDGIAQSLFLISVKVEQLKAADTCAPNTSPAYAGLHKVTQELNAYVRQAISSLRAQPKGESAAGWEDAIFHLISQFGQEHGIPVTIDWNIPEASLSIKEKVELYSSVREGLLNISKHAGASQVSVQGCTTPGGWQVSIKDNGQGLDEEQLNDPNRFGLRIIRERAEALGWKLSLSRSEKHTILRIQKG
ncbi:sensor histidine kinase [Paenibacillus lemnae]|uniref:histidine kinase n=1 Tax=Paenibacillus lemnae TaxID=1330551 RepID=A0A848M0P1_PAELE|nr:histidine kinase [Paenibacillus lemnae]NMO94488.1 sensor histidine kinase [Paenibacillus lemnae]